MTGDGKKNLRVGLSSWLAKSSN